MVLQDGIANGELDTLAIAGGRGGCCLILVAGAAGDSLALAVAGDGARDGLILAGGARATREADVVQGAAARLEWTKRNSEVRSGQCMPS